MLLHGLRTCNTCLCTLSTAGPTVLQEQTGNWSQCAQEGVAVKARRGDALLFWSLMPNGDLDPASLHRGCPVLSGDAKWSATKWMR